MIIDFEDDKGPTSFDCDVAIVGAGAVGLLMAVELADQGVDVLLIEGGGASISASNQDLNEAVISGREMSGLQNARFRLLGGSTNFWGGQILRFDAAVFEPRPWLGSKGWPFGRVELDFYYDRVARLMGLEDDFSDAELWLRAGIVPPDLGPCLRPFLTRCLLNRSTADVFKNELDGGSFRTLVHANVVALSSLNEGRQVNGLVIRSLTGREGTVNANKVVLACGTVEIARLLLSPLASGSEPVWSDNPWVGRGFVDHLEAIAGKVKLLDKKKFHNIFDNIYINNIKYFPRIKFSIEGQMSTGSLDIAGRFEFRSQYKEHLANLKLFVRSLLNGRRPEKITKLPLYLVALWKVSVPLIWRYLKSKRAYNPADGGVDLVMMSEQMPTPDSRIVLAREKNKLGMMKVDVRWKIADGELETMASFAEKCKEEFARLGLAEIEIDPLLIARDEKFMNGVLDYYHQMGGARIGDGPNEGVVDADLKVYGTENLYVGGAAVYPSTGFGNPTYTAMALGLRLSDHLVRDNA